MKTVLIWNHIIILISEFVWSDYSVQNQVSNAYSQAVKQTGGAWSWEPGSSPCSFLTVVLSLHATTIFRSALTLGVLCQQHIACQMLVRLLRQTTSLAARCFFSRSKATVITECVLQRFEDPIKALIKGPRACSILLQTAFHLPQPYSIFC